MTRTIVDGERPDSSVVVAGWGGQEHWHPLNPSHNLMFDSEKFAQERDFLPVPIGR